jgi:acyl-CoA hydrolase
MKAKRVEESKTIMTQLVMPNDTNHMGNLMGGNLLSWMDMASPICAGKHTEKSVVTASVDQVSFEKAILLGEVVTIKAAVTRAFNTSLEIFVEVFAASITGSNPRKCNQAYFTFVALDENGQPTGVPPITPLSEIEQKRYDEAPNRKSFRLQNSGKI